MLGGGPADRRAVTRGGTPPGAAAPGGRRHPGVPARVGAADRGPQSVAQDLSRSGTLRREGRRLRRDPLGRYGRAAPRAEGTDLRVHLRQQDRAGAGRHDLRPPRNAPPRPGGRGLASASARAGRAVHHRRSAPDAALRALHGWPMMAAKAPAPRERQMKALQYTRFGSPDVLELIDRPIPRATEDDAVVHFEAAAVQPSDIKSVAGVMDGTVLPRTPGRDFSGVVVEGPTWLLGRAVWGTAGDLGFSRDGTHAQYVRFPVAGLGPRPFTLSAEEAAAVPVTFITAWIGLIDAAQVREGETVV